MGEDLMLTFAPSRRSEHLELEWAAVQSDATVPVASVDCEADPSLCSSYGVSVSPLLKLFVKGDAVATYQGPRRASALV